MGTDLHTIVQILEALTTEERNFNKKHYGHEIMTIQNFEEILFRSSQKNKPDLQQNHILGAPEPFYMELEEIYPSVNDVPAHVMMHLQKCGSSSAENHLVEIGSTMTFLHSHEFYEMIYVYKGNYTTIIEDKKLQLSEKELCLLNRNCMHVDLREESSGIILFVGIHPSLLDEYFVNSLLPGAWKSFLLHDMKNKHNISFMTAKLADERLIMFEACCTKIYEELMNCDIGYLRVLQILFVRMVNLLEQNGSGELTKYPQNMKKRMQFLLIDEYIQSHLPYISIELLVNVFHYQADYYSRLIRQFTGLTFSGYVQKLRIDRAKSLLYSTNMSVKDIADLLGYTDESYFFRQFRSLTGQTPACYRKSYNL